VEVSLTQVFTRPVQGRHFFEAVGRENLDLGRPDRVGLLFPPPHHATVSAPGWDCRTRVTNGCICWSLLAGPRQRRGDRGRQHGSSPSVRR
jgi:hypothetical protein